MSLLNTDIFEFFHTELIKFFSCNPFLYTILVVLVFYRSQTPFGNDEILKKIYLKLTKLNETHINQKMLGSFLHEYFQ
jgi:hypothetical protein